MLCNALEVARLICLAVFLQPGFAQYNRATSVEVQNGKPTAWWAEQANSPATKIKVTSPLPTIYYNCHYAGSLCKNVELTQPGAFAGTIDMELVYDKDGDRRDTRRRRICPSLWNQAHTCPETDQPDVYVLDSTRNLNDDATAPNKIQNTLKHPMGVKGKNNYLISDDFNLKRLSRTPSGLMYTCDEFPFASTIQGGIGLKQDPTGGLTYGTTTYCAPQGSRCARDVTWLNDWLAFENLSAQWKALTSQPKIEKIKFRKKHGLVYPTSDQNLQGDALQELSGYFADFTDDDLFLFKLRTINDKDDRRFAYMELGDADDQNGDDDGDDDIDMKRDLQSHVKEITNTANSSTYHDRGIDLRLDVGLGIGGSRIGASLALGHHSTSELISSEGLSGLILASTSRKMSGFVSIIRSGTGTSAFTKSSGSTLSSAQSGPYTMTTSPLVSSQRTDSTSTGVSLATTVPENPEARWQNNSDALADASRSGLPTILVSQLNGSTIYSSAMISPVTLISLSSANNNGLTSAKSSMSTGTEYISTGSSMHPENLTVATSSTLNPMNTGMPSWVVAQSQNDTDLLTPSTAFASTSTSLSANMSFGIQIPSTSPSESSDMTTSNTVKTLPAFSLNNTIVSIPLNFTSVAGTSAMPLGVTTSTEMANATATGNVIGASGSTSSTPSSTDTTSTSSSPLLLEPNTTISTSLATSVNLSTVAVPEIWGTSSPVVACSPPCIVILPPTTLPESTTITPDPITISDQTIMFPPITTDVISFSQVTVQNPGDIIIPIPVINPPSPITLPDGQPPATDIPKVTIRLPILPPIALETPPTANSPVPSPARPTPEPSSTPVPPPPPVPTDEETEEEEEEEEDEEDEDCDVPGWDPSDFPMPEPDEETADTQPQESAAPTTGDPSSTTTISLEPTDSPSSEQEAMPSTSESIALPLTSESAPPSSTPESSAAPPTSTSEPPPPPLSTSEPAPPPPPPPSPPPVPSSHPPCETVNDCDCGSDPNVFAGCSGPKGAMTCHCG